MITEPARALADAKLEDAKRRTVKLDPSHAGLGFGLAALAVAFVPHVGDWLTPLVALLAAGCGAGALRAARTRRSRGFGLVALLSAALAVLLAVTFP